MLAESLHQQGVLQKEVIEQLSNYLPEEQNKIEDEDAEDALIYGIECYQLKDNIFYESMISLSPITSNELQFINKTTKNILKTNFYIIANITFKNTKDISSIKKNENISEYSCQILLDRESYEFHY